MGILQIWNERLDFSVISEQANEKNVNSEPLYYVIGYLSDFQVNSEVFHGTGMFNLWVGLVDYTSATPVPKKAAEENNVFSGFMIILL